MSNSPYCGMGHGTFDSAAGGVVRGGHYGDEVDKVGVFATSLTNATGAASSIIGFRCVYAP